MQLITNKHNMKKKTFIAAVGLIAVLCYIVLHLVQNPVTVASQSCESDFTITEESDTPETQFVIFKEGFPSNFCQTQTNPTVVNTYCKELTDQIVFREFSQEEIIKIKTHNLLRSSLSYLSLQAEYGYYTYRQGKLII